MTELKERWTAALPPFPEQELAAVAAHCGARLEAVCCSFWLYRFLHRLSSPEAVLMGDACFARCSRHLAALDSVALTDRFAAFLREDSIHERTLADYLSFVRELGEAR